MLLPYPPSCLLIVLFIAAHYINLEQSCINFDSHRLGYVSHYVLLLPASHSSHNDQSYNNITISGDLIAVLLGQQESRAAARKPCDAAAIPVGFHCHVVAFRFSVRTRYAV